VSNSKISALTAATTPVAGTEVLPIVQSSTTKQVSIANLTPGLDTITAAKGGTGQTTYAVGDLLYANTTTTLARLADVATGNALISGGVGVAPAWGKIGLTTHVSGVLPVANGGTNASAASITAFNNITGYSAAGATGTTSTNLVFSTSPTLTTPKATTTIGVGNATPSASGSGVSFPSVQSASTDANTLDDYAEGTWTPAFVNGTFGYSFQSGFYTKIGRLVTASGLIVWSSKSGSGNLSISLPFAINSSNYYRGGISLGNCNGLILAAGYAIVGTLDQSATSIDFYFNVSGAAAQQMTIANMNSSGAVQFTATYMV
jgi:hypothetical protein